MGKMPNNQEREKIRDAVRLREERSARGKKEGERPLLQNLSMIGALGWLIVLPTLLGMFLGRWLDATFGTGIFFSGALIFVGIGTGCYFAWQRVNKE
jgi:ATP synthase protein I